MRFLFIENCRRLFDINLIEVDKGVSKIVALFNERFTDGKTAFVFTADHGMSNKGMDFINQNVSIENELISEIFKI